jgi:hypothetical protein
MMLFGFKSPFLISKGGTISWFAHEYVHFCLLCKTNQSETGRLKGEKGEGEGERKEKGERKRVPLLGSRPGKQLEKTRKDMVKSVFVRQ